MRLRGSAGFTTLEMLLTLALLALLTVGVAGGLKTGQQAWRAARVNERRSEIEAAARAITILIEKAVPYAARRDGLTAGIAFGGLKDALNFIYLSEGGKDWGGFVVASLWLSPQGELRLSSSPIRELGQARVAASQTVVLNDVRELRLEYLGEADAAGHLVWSDSWTGRNSLPRLVKIRLTRSRDGKVDTVEFTSKLRQT